MTEPSITAPAGRGKRATRRWAVRVIGVLVAAAIVAAIVMAWLPKSVEVETAPARRAAMTVTVDEDGRTRVVDRYIISAPLAGNLMRVELQPGDRVAAGAVVARLLPLPTPLLDPRSRAQAEAQLAAASAGHGQAQAQEARIGAALEFAESEIVRDRQLAARGSIPQEALERAELALRTTRQDLASAGFGVRVARQEVEIARAALGRLAAGKAATDQMVLASSVDGVVLEVLREDEGVIAAGTPLLEIGNPIALEVVVDVLTTDAVRITAGARARLVRWGGDDELIAHVRRVEPKAFTRMSSLGVDEQRVNVVLDLDSPPASWSALGDGYRVEASIVVWDEPDVVQVPVSAVFKRDDRWTVFVMAGGRARRRPIEVGQRNGFEAQVVSGLAPGEVVIVHPGERVSDGARVRTR